ncbi:MAG TPA: hypothetical protein VMU69_19995 [Bradyrhizobium sp.]|nr:hypothetical protein [Bradyrhizobium sp.]
MADTAVELPDDIETLKAMVLAARAETAQLRAVNHAQELALRGIGWRKAPRQDRPAF